MAAAISTREIAECARTWAEGDGLVPLSELRVGTTPKGEPALLLELLYSEQFLASTKAAAEKSPAHASLCATPHRVEAVVAWPVVSVLVRGLAPLVLPGPLAGSTTSLCSSFLSALKHGGFAGPVANNAGLQELEANRETGTEAGTYAAVQVRVAPEHARTASEALSELRSAIAQASAEYAIVSRCLEAFVAAGNDAGAGVNAAQEASGEVRGAVERGSAAARTAALSELVDAFKAQELRFEPRPGALVLYAGPSSTAEDDARDAAAAPGLSAMSEAERALGAPGLMVAVSTKGYDSSSGVVTVDLVAVGVGGDALNVPADRSRRAAAAALAAHANTDAEAVAKADGAAAAPRLALDEDDGQLMAIATVEYRSADAARLHAFRSAAVGALGGVIGMWQRCFRAARLVAAGAPLARALGAYSAPVPAADAALHNSGGNRLVARAMAAGARHGLNMYQGARTLEMAAAGGMGFMLGGLGLGGFGGGGAGRGEDAIASAYYYELDDVMAAAADGQRAGTMAARERGLSIQLAAAAPSHGPRAADTAGGGGRRRAVSRADTVFRPRAPPNRLDAAVEAALAGGRPRAATVAARPEPAAAAAAGDATATPVQRLAYYRANEDAAGPEQRQELDRVVTYNKDPQQAEGRDTGEQYGGYGTYAYVLEDAPGGAAEAAPAAAGTADAWDRDVVRAALARLEASGWRDDERPRTASRDAGGAGGGPQGRARSESAAVRLGKARAADSYAYKWNERYQRMFEASLSSKGGAHERHERRVTSEFTAKVREVAETIVAELALPPGARSVRPLEEQVGVAGGSKMQVDGIFFKFATDRAGLYGGDEFAAKAACNELRAMRAVAESGVPHLHTTLSAVVRVRGHTVIAAALAPISRDTLVYGSDNGLADVRDSSDVFRRHAAQLASLLHLKPHAVRAARGGGGGDGGAAVTSLVLAGDVEGHHSTTDGRLYLVDLARLMPPAPPGRDGTRQDLYNLLRPEFMRAYPAGALSPDAHLGWGADPDATRRDAAELVAAFAHLKTRVVPQAAKILAELPAERLARPGAVSAALHGVGVNMRYLGLVTQRVHGTDALRRRVTREMVARCLKARLRRVLRSIVRVSGVPHAAATRQLLRLVRGLDRDRAAASDALWRDLLPRDLLHKYFYSLPGAHSKPERARRPDRWESASAALWGTVGVHYADIDEMRRELGPDGDESAPAFGLLAAALSVRPEALGRAWLDEPSPAPPPLKKDESDDAADGAGPLVATVKLGAAALRGSVGRGGRFGGLLGGGAGGAGGSSGTTAEREARLLEELRIRTAAVGRHHVSLVSSLLALITHYYDRAEHGGETFQGNKYIEWLFEPEMPPITPSAAGICGMTMQDLAYDASGRLDMRAGRVQLDGGENPERLFVRALALLSYGLGPNHGETGVCAGNLATLYKKMGRYEEALPLFDRAFLACQQHFGLLYERTLHTMYNKHTCLLQMGRVEEARDLLEKEFACSFMLRGAGNSDTQQDFMELVALDQRVEEHRRETAQRSEHLALLERHRAQAALWAECKGSGAFARWKRRFLVLESDNALVAYKRHWREMRGSGAAANADDVAARVLPSGGGGRTGVVSATGLDPETGKTYLGVAGVSGAPKRRWRPGPAPGDTVILCIRTDDLPGAGAFLDALVAAGFQSVDLDEE